MATVSLHLLMRFSLLNSGNKFNNNYSKRVKFFPNVYVKNFWKLRPGPYWQDRLVFLSHIFPLFIAYIKKNIQVKLRQIYCKDFANAYAQTSSTELGQWFFSDVSYSMLRLYIIKYISPHRKVGAMVACSYVRYIASTMSEYKI